MIERIRDNIYRIGVRLPDNPLRELNSYLILGDEHDLLIDTGFRREECRQDLLAGIAEAGSSTERLDVLTTHMHSDHSGLAPEVAGKDRRIYMSERDLTAMRSATTSIVAQKSNLRFETEGFSKEMLEQIHAGNPIVKYRMPGVDERFVAVRNGDEISVGGYTLKVIFVPGHTPGNIMLWLEQERIMFTGDHILFGISPNITFFPDVEDSLGDYLDSLRKSRSYPVELALPGHRQRGNYHERIDALLAHHEERLAEAVSVVAQNPGNTAYDIAGMMQWRIRARNWAEFPMTQKWFAVGECLSHLDYLRKRGLVRREMVNGSWRYYKADE